MLGKANGKEEEKSKREGKEKGRGKDAEGLERIHLEKNQVGRDVMEKGKDDHQDDVKVEKQGRRRGSISTSHC